MQLDVSDLTDNPFDLVARWYDEARLALPEPEAMTLATIGLDGLPEARMVLMRGMVHTPGREGLVFYTNYHSDKGQALARHPGCAALLYWGPLEGGPPFGARQVRVRGRAERAPEVMSDDYYRARPRVSQLGAWASPQSEPIPDRAFLDARVAEVEQRFEGVEQIPRPPFWGGFVLVAETVEVWQGRVGRLHDRFRYHREGGGWRFERLAP